MWRVDGAWVAHLHTLLAFSSFLTALVVGVALHYEKIVRNGYYGYPQEWFPSVSATIGDWAPERCFFQIGMVLTMGPRVPLLLLLWLHSRQRGTFWPNFVSLCGFGRLLSSAVWMFITSTDNHDLHDIGMGVYLVLTVPWLVGNILLTPVHQRRSKQQRQFCALGYLACGIAMVPLYIQHKVHRVAGAYSRYAYFEWGLVFFDVLFDAVSARELSDWEICFVRKTEFQGQKELRPTTQVSPNTTQPIPETRLAEWRHFLADVYLSFCFWTALTGQALLIYWFSVWAMGLGGHEAFLLFNLFPVLLGVTSVRNFVVAQRETLTFVSVLTVSGCYLWHNSPLRYQFEDAYIRLCILALGLALFIITAAATLWTDAQIRGKETPIVFTLGLIVATTAKFANYGMNPLWPTTDPRYWKYQNTPAFVLAILAAIDRFARPRPQQPVPSPVSHKGSPIAPSSVSKVGNGSATLAAFGLGGLLFSFHAFATDATTLIIWSFEGYPNRGPTIFHGCLTILAMSIGLVLSMFTELPANSVWWHVGLSGLAVLYAATQWAAFAGGLLFLTLVFSCAPVLLYSSFQHAPGRTFFIAWLTYDVLVLLSIFCTAYAFVPYGHIVRERSDIMLLLTVVCLFIGLRCARPPTPQPRRQTVSSRLKALSLLALCVIGGFTSSFYRAQRAVVPQPFHPEDRILTAGIWTVHFGLESHLHDSQRRLRDALVEAELDVVGFAESDLQRIVTGNRDLTQIIAQEAGYYVDYGPGPQKHTWGVTLFSKFPIKNSTHHLLPSPHGELAPALTATLDVYGREVDVVVAHNGQEEDVLDRQLQSQELGRLLRERFPTPTIFLGYLVTKPHADRPSPYKYLVEDGLMLDIDPGDLDRWCEYILFRGLHRIGYARISRGRTPSLTDTELWVAIPGRLTGHDPKADRWGVSWFQDCPWTPPSTAQQVPQRRFSDRFKTGAVNGQVFHVLGMGSEAQPYYYPIQSVVQTKS